MIQLKNLVAAFMVIALFAESDSANAEGKLYVEGGVTWTQPGDVGAEFTSENVQANWDLSSMLGGKVQIGSDFGKVRVDAKFQYLEGDVDGIDKGVTNVKSVTNGDGPDAALGVATLNLYYDFDVNKGAETSFTPYLGFGVGLARGFMQAEGTLTSILREDHRTSDGAVLAGIAGAFFPINDNAGITTEYEYLHVDFGGLNAHSLTLGLRMSF